MKIINKFLAVVLVTSLLVSVSITGSITFAGMKDQINSGMNSTDMNSSAPTNVDSVIKNITNTLLFIIGAISVIMLIYGGIRYTTSGGNANSVTAAKNTIMYSVIGLIVAILAYAIVNFVVDSLIIK